MSIHFQPSDFHDPNSPLYPALRRIILSKLPRDVTEFEYSGEPHVRAVNGEYRVDVYYRSHREWRPIHFTIVDLIREMHR